MGLSRSTTRVAFYLRKFIRPINSIFNNRFDRRLFWAVLIYAALNRPAQFNVPVALSLLHGSGGNLRAADSNYHPRCSSRAGGAAHKPAGG